MESKQNSKHQTKNCSSSSLVSTNSNLSTSSSSPTASSNLLPSRNNNNNKSNKSTYITRKKPNSISNSSSFNSNDSLLKYIKNSQTASTLTKKNPIKTGAFSLEKSNYSSKAKQFTNFLLSSSSNQQDDKEIPAKYNADKEFKSQSKVFFSPSASASHTYCNIKINTNNLNESSILQNSLSSFLSTSAHATILSSSSSKIITKPSSSSTSSTNKNNTNISINNYNHNNISGCNYTSSSSSSSKTNNNNNNINKELLLFSQLEEKPTQKQVVLSKQYSIEEKKKTQTDGSCLATYLHYPSFTFSSNRSNNNSNNNNNYNYSKKKSGELVSPASPPLFLTSSDYFSSSFDKNSPQSTKCTHPATTSFFSQNLEPLSYLTIRKPITTFSNKMTSSYSSNLESSSEKQPSSPPSSQNDSDTSQQQQQQQQQHALIDETASNLEKLNHVKFLNDSGSSTIASSSLSTSNSISSTASSYSSSSLSPPANNSNQPISPISKSGANNCGNPLPIHSRFIIKKLPEAEQVKYTTTKQQSTTPPPPPLQSDLSGANVDALKVTVTSDASEQQKIIDINTSTSAVAPNNERRINKFTVKKVDSSTNLLYTKTTPYENNNNNNNAVQLKETAVKEEDDEENNKLKKENSFEESDVKQQQVELNQSELDKTAQSQNQQQLMQQNSQQEQSQVNLNMLMVRTSSVIEKNEQTETEKQQQQHSESDIQEDEKPIDESPDKRFLKYDTDIGHGSFKTVYKGLDTESGVPVAWCELHDRKFNKTERQRFIEEAEMLKKLQHPNIVRFYEYWEDTKTKPKKIILVTELMTSGTLKAYVQRFKKQEKSKRFKVIKNFANQILKGLAYLHGRQPPVIHRDLKCDNVFVTGQCGQVKIGDLGLATLKKSSFAKSVIGTPEFMAPEMYLEQYDESIDVYAFGMCLLEMATGEYPYQECTKPFEIYKRVTKGIKPENYNRIDSNDELKELIDVCIRLKKSQRPTVKELLNHSWFMENNGLKLELSKDDVTKKIIYTNESQVLFRLKLIDKSKHKNWPDNEAIEFIFDVDNDNPEHIAKELKENIDKINEEDLRYLIQAIKDKCLVFKLEREDRLEEEANALNNNNTSTNINSNNFVSNSTSNTANAPASSTSILTNSSAVNMPATATKKTSTLTNLNLINNESNANLVASTLTGSVTQTQLQATAQQTTITQPIQQQNLNKTPEESLPIQQEKLQNQQIEAVGNINQTDVMSNENNANKNQVTFTSKQQSIDLSGQQSQTHFYSQQQVNFQEPDAVSEGNNNDQPSSSQSNKEIPLKFTIKELLETPETGEVVNCILEVDGKHINFKFGLNADTPEDIASRLLNATKIENTNYLIELIQNVIQYINQNKHNQKLNNKQFLTQISNASSSLKTPIETTSELVNSSNNSANNTNNSTNEKTNQTAQQINQLPQVQTQQQMQQQLQQPQIQQQSQQQQPQQQIQQQKLAQPNLPVNNINQGQAQQTIQPQLQQQTSNKILNQSVSGPNLSQQFRNQIQQQPQQLSQQLSSSELFKTLQQKQQQLNTELQQINNRIEINTSQLAFNSNNNINCNQTNFANNNNNSTQLNYIQQTQYLNGAGQNYPVNVFPLQQQQYVNKQKSQSNTDMFTNHNQLFPQNFNSNFNQGLSTATGTSPQVLVGSAATTNPINSNQVSSQNQNNTISNYPFLLQNNNNNSVQEFSDQNEFELQLVNNHHTASSMLPNSFSNFNQINSQTTAATVPNNYNPNINNLQSKHILNQASQFNLENSTFNSLPLNYATGTNGQFNQNSVQQQFYGYPLIKSSTMSNMNSPTHFLNNNQLNQLQQQQMNFNANEQPYIINSNNVSVSVAANKKIDSPLLMSNSNFNLNQPGSNFNNQENSNLVQTKPSYASIVETNLSNTNDTFVTSKQYHQQINNNTSNSQTQPSMQLLQTAAAKQTENNINNNNNNNIMSMSLNETSFDQADLSLNSDELQINLLKTPNLLMHNNSTANLPAANNNAMRKNKTDIVVETQKSQEKESNNKDLAELGVQLRNVLNSGQDEVNVSQQLLQQQLNNNILLMNQSNIGSNPSLIQANNSNLLNYEMIPSSTPPVELNSVSYGLNAQQVQAQLNNQLPKQQNNSNIQLNYVDGTVGGGGVQTIQQTYQSQQQNMSDLNSASYPSSCPPSYPISRRNSVDINKENLSRLLAHAGGSTFASHSDSSTFNLITNKQSPVQMSQSNTWIMDQIDNPSRRISDLSLGKLAYEQLTNNDTLPSNTTQNQIDHLFINPSLSSNNLMMQKNNQQQKQQMHQEYYLNDSSLSLIDSQLTQDENSKSLDDLFLKHRRELEDLLKQQQNELHIFLLNQSKMNWKKINSVNITNNNSSNSNKNRNNINNKNNNSNNI